jgi:hypothetical protein
LISFLFTALAFLILIPVLLFLPLGLTRRGAWTVAFASLLFGSFGLLAKAVFPLWQVVLLLLLLTAASTYLLDRKLGHLLYATALTDDEEEKMVVIEEEVVEDEEQMEWIESLGSSDETLQKETPQEASVLVDESSSDDYLEELVHRDLDDALQAIEEPKTEPLSLSENFDEGLEKKETQEEVLPLFDELSSDEEWDELFDQPLENELESSEYEQLEKWTEPEKTDDELEELFLENETETSEAELLAAWTEEDSYEELEELTLIEEDPQIDLENEQTEEKQSPLQKELMKNLAAQLQAMRKYVDGDEYERLIREHLHPNLHEQDYYTFASLLIEHYLASHQYEKLSQLLMELREKWTSYPILQQQIEFLIEYVQQKMG